MNPARYEHNAKVIKIVPRVIGAGVTEYCKQFLARVMVVVGAVAMYFGQPWGANLLGAGIWHDDWWCRNDADAKN